MDDLSDSVATLEPENFVNEQEYKTFTYLLYKELTLAQNNPHITYETLVIRILKRLAEENFKLSWTAIQESMKQGQCLMDAELHKMLQDFWQQRKKNQNAEDQHCVERVLGRDYVRLTDLSRIATCFNRFVEDKKQLWIFFAVDGFLGDDIKSYVDGFKFGPDDIKGKHIRAVRQLYRNFDGIATPKHMKEVLEGVFQGKGSIYSNFYLEQIGKDVLDVASWRLDLHEKWKKKNEESERGECSNKRPSDAGEKSRHKKIKVKRVKEN